MSECPMCHGLGIHVSIARPDDPASRVRCPNEALEFIDAERRAYMYAMGIRRLGDEPDNPALGIWAKRAAPTGRFRKLKVKGNAFRHTRREN